MSHHEFMTPLNYLSLYHGITFNSPLDNEPLLTEVTGYGSGWGSEKSNRTKDERGNESVNDNQGKLCQLERAKFNTALRVLVNGSPQKPTKNRIYFRQDAGRYVDTEEVFFDNAFLRAFVGRGSPDEITDLLRVAILVGRIKIGLDASGWKAARYSLGSYVKAFVTIDCNGFAGNYWGVDPDTDLSNYAAPVRARKRIQDVATGDAVVTISADGKCKHVAVINDFWVQESSGSGGKAQVRICEWGDAGDIDHHSPWIGGGTPIDIKASTKYGVYWERDGKSRYIFAPPRTPAPRRWGLGSNDGW